MKTVGEKTDVPNGTLPTDAVSPAQVPCTSASASVGSATGGTGLEVVVIHPLSEQVEFQRQMSLSHGAHGEINPVEIDTS